MTPPNARKSTPKRNGLEDSPNGTRILLDSPSGEPALGFDRTARALAQIATDSSPQFSIGIFGGWGSGKTTLMRSIQHQLPDNVVPVEFNAWRFEREAHLLVPLLDTVRTALVDWAKTGTDVDTKERVRRVARRLARVIRGLATGLSGEVSLGVAKVGYDVGKAVDALTMNDDPDQPQSLYVAAFQELSEAFTEFTAAGATRVVVFVDDLDRCLPSNALDVLEAMKLFFDLPGFIFVVGLDEDVVQRAVRTRFPSERDVTSGPAGPEPGGTASSQPDAQLARDYVEKIFQVPYRLPPMVADQLDPLLEAMYADAKLSGSQLQDFRQRVGPHLRYAAVERQINPREVKRFLNTYTLQTLVRPELDRDTVLPLQTLQFRYEWRPLYDAILTDSILFQDALRRFRKDEASAFEDVSPELAVIGAELSEYLRSDAVAPLANQPSLDPYVSSLEASGSFIPTWLTDSYRDIGTLRSEARRVLRSGTPGEEDARQLARIGRDTQRQLSSRASFFEARFGTISPQLQHVETTVMGLEQGVQSGSPVLQEEVTRAATQLLDLANRIYRDLRSTRDTLTVTVRS